jgi:hypothetical protein
LREQELIWPPPVSFTAKSKRPKKNTKSKSGDDDDESDSDAYRSVEVHLDPMKIMKPTR